MPTTLPRTHYLSQRICPNCKSRELKDGYSTCEVCKEAVDKWMHNNRARKNSYNKTRYDSLRMQGLCVTCKTPTDGNVYCKTCTDKICANRAYHRGLRSRNRWSKR